MIARIWAQYNPAENQTRAPYIKCRQYKRQIEKNTYIIEEMKNKMRYVWNDFT